MKEDRPSSSTASRIVSGSVGSIIYVTAFAPLEVVKVRQQAAASSGSSSFPSWSGPPPVKALLRGRGAVVLSDGLVVPTSSFPCLAAAAPRSRAAAAYDHHPHRVVDRRSGVLSSLRAIARNEGRAGLYAGLKPTLYATVPNAAVYLASYDEISSRLSRRDRRRRRRDNDHEDDDRDDHRGHWIPFVAGASARLASSVVTAPLELVRTRQAANPIRRGGVLEEFRLIVKTSGLAGLYRGLVPMILRDVPFGATYFPTLELTRSVMSNSTFLGSWGKRHHRVEMMGTRPPVAVDALEAFVGGMIAGSLATVLTTPFDVVKTRRMTTTSSHTTCLVIRPGGGGTMFDHMRRIFQEEGHAGLWRGNCARMMKVAPGSAIMISSYESGKRLLEDVM
ncbi:hypothetical protein ACHAW5_001321 [Stephanodiscus triporus]|uniref:Mitochondrial carrier protein n=1 Tax=Stephanodiscus triporus TaxID=2934178 RepID=A0ABD3Q4S3_9STRA